MNHIIIGFIISLLIFISHADASSPLSCAKDGLGLKGHSELFVYHGTSEKRLIGIMISPNGELRQVAEIDEINPSQNTDIQEIDPSVDNDVQEINPSIGDDVQEIKPNIDDDVQQIDPSKDNDVQEIKPDANSDIETLKP